MESSILGAISDEALPIAAQIGLNLAHNAESAANQVYEELAHNGACSALVTAKFFSRFPASRFAIDSLLHLPYDWPNPSFQGRNSLPARFVIESQ